MKEEFKEKLKKNIVPIAIVVAVLLILIIILIFVNVSKNNSTNSNNSNIENIAPDTTYNPNNNVVSLMAPDNVPTPTTPIEELEINTQLIGEWMYVDALQDGNSVGLSAIFEGNIEENAGNIILNDDGTFLNNLPGVSAEEGLEISGTYTSNETNVVTTHDGQTETLTVNSPTKISQEYQGYTLILEKVI